MARTIIRFRGGSITAQRRYAGQLQSLVIRTGKNISGGHMGGQDTYIVHDGKDSAASLGLQHLLEDQGLTIVSVEEVKASL